MKTTRLLLVVVALGIAGAVTWFVLDQPQEPAQPPVPSHAAVAVDAGAQPSAAVDLAEGDLIAQDLVPASWLAGGDAVRRAAAAVYAVSTGQSPRVMVPFLDPGGTFTVEEKNKRFFISAKNDARYDGVTKAFTSIDAEAVGRLYGKLRPYLDAAFREIAPPGKTFDGAFTAAVERLVNVPIADGPREVVPLEQGVGYAWADPKLEALSPAEKHLLRMGPKNARAVVKQLQAFRAAMSAG